MAWAEGAAPVASARDSFSSLFPELSVVWPLVSALALLAVLLGAIWWRIRSVDDKSHRDAPPEQVAASAPVRASDAPPPAPQRIAQIRPQFDEIDSIQQAEFLSLLGERDAAVALLTAHIDSEAGAQATVWIKLMQIHRRFGDRHSFEALRPRYRQRFGTEAPPWARDLPAGEGDERQVSVPMPSTVPPPMSRDGDRPAARPPSA